MAAPAIPDRDAPPTTYLTQALIDLRARRKAEVERHEQELRDYDAAIAQTERERTFVLDGMTLEEVRLAESVIYVENEVNRTRGEGPSVIRDAVNDLAQGTPKLRSTAFSTKRYDRWDGQREDHRYGYGPRHGTTIFEVGLREEARKRDPVELHPDIRHSTRLLTPEETEAAIRYLLTIERRLA